MRAKIVVLISGSGSNLQAIIDQCESNQIQGDVVAVISNKPDAFGLKRAKNHGIANFVISHSDYTSREAFDLELANKINTFSPDLIVLAGFMRILSDGFVEQFSGKMINIHPSLLPKYPGLNTHQRAIENRDNKHGASIHFVSAELDGGPVVLQSEIPIYKHDCAESLAKRVNVTEWIIYPLVVKWFCMGALKMVQEQVWFNTKLIKRDSFNINETCKLPNGESFECKIILPDNNEGQNRHDEDLV